MTLSEYKLVTVSPAPDVAKAVVARVTEEFKDKFIIKHVANADAIESVKAVVEKEQPDVLFTAPIWTPEQGQEIVKIAKGVIPNLKTLNIQHGLHAGDDVLAFVKENLPGVIEG